MIKQKNIATTKQGRGKLALAGFAIFASLRKTPERKHNARKTICTSRSRDTLYSKTCTECTNMRFAVVHILSFLPSSAQNLNNCPTINSKSNLM